MSRDLACLAGLGLDGADYPVAQRAADRAAVCAMLDSQAEIRLFIDATAHLGHQASGLQMLGALVHDYGYRGAVSVVYLEGDVYRGLTIDKLRALAPDLDARAGSSVLVGGALVRWIPYSARAALSRVRLGFACGADLLPQGNLARELRTDWLLRLQPFGWYRASDQIERASEDAPLPLVLEDLCARPYLVRDVAADGGESWTAHADDSMQARIALLECFLRRAPRALVAPVYGVREPCLQGSSAADLFSLYAAALLSAGEDFHSGVRAVLIDFDDTSRETVKAIEETLRGQARPIHPTLIARRAGKPDRGIEAGLERARWMVAAGVAERTRIVGPGARVDELERVLDWLADRRDGVVILHLGGIVPHRCFAAALASATLPALIEGQSSASLGMSTGRPYLHARNIAMTRGARYFVPPNGDASIARDLEAVTDDLVWGAAGAIPFARAVKRVARFVREASLESSSLLSGYYRQLATWLEQDGNDKLSLGLTAFARVVSGLSQLDVR